MNLAEQITEDMKTSMKAGDSARTGVLRLLRGAFKNEEIKTGSPLDDAGQMKVLQREAKQRKDSIAAYSAAGRNDLVANEEAELAIIATYLPQQMSEDELTALVEKVVAETGANGPAAMGQVIGAVMKQAGAAADGGLVARLVKEKLSA